MNSMLYRPTSEQRKLLDSHLELVIKENKTTNLTRIIDWDSAQILHVEDSLVGLPEINKAQNGRYLDMGTGAGFPGIPVAIMTGRETVLADSVGKKTKALDRIILELELSSYVSTFNGHIEDVALHSPQSFSVITARALSSLSSLLELASPLLIKEGLLICYKSQEITDELAHAIDVSEKLGFKFLSQRNTTLSDGATDRSIIVFQKYKNASVKLPRRVGMAQKKPY